MNHHASAVPTAGPRRPEQSAHERGPRREGPAGAPPAQRDDFRGSSRYELLVKIGTGGSASVYIGRVTGSAGFSRLVAVKRAHPHLAHDPGVERMMKTEARLASGVNHANVVAVQDVEHIDSELLLILEYVEGASLSELLEAGVKTGRELPSRVAIRIALDACAGLSAVHEIEGRDGRPVGFLHRDVSPQNILVGVDGTARITDFGLAKHQNAGLSKATGSLKGKLAYLAPEIIDEGVFSVQSDIFAMGVVLWEALAKRRLFRGDSWADTVRKVGLEDAPPLSSIVPALGQRLDGVVAKALEKVASRRYGSVRELQSALESMAGGQNLIATSSEVSNYVRSVVGDALQRRRELIRSFDVGGSVEDTLTTDTLAVPLPHGRAAHVAQAVQAAQAAYVGPGLSGSARAWSTTLDLTPTVARRPAAVVVPPSQPALVLPRPVPFPERVVGSPRLRPTAAPEPPTPQSFGYAVEIAPEEMDLDIEDEESTLNSAPRHEAAPVAEPARRPAPEAPPVAMPGFLQRHMPRVEVRELPKIYYADEESEDTSSGVGSAASLTPSAWTEDPLAAWAPPTPPPPASAAPEWEAPRTRARARGRKLAGLLTFGAAAGAALLLALVPSLLSPAPAGSAQPQAAAAQPQGAVAQVAVAQPQVAVTQPAKPAPAAGGVLTPDALPDAAPGSGGIDALTPDELPDVTPAQAPKAAAPRAAAPRAAAPPPQAPKAAAKGSGGRRSPANPYRR